MYNCPNVGVCGGFENSTDNESCVVCEHPRPPMSELIAEAKAKLKEQKALEDANKDEDSEEEQGEPLHEIRMKMLRRDIRHVISHH